MAPMARTNRNSNHPAAMAPSVDQLDGLNLDDMFEGGNDGLFDDIGMEDLGDLGDISATTTTPMGANTLRSSSSNKSKSSNSSNLDDRKFDFFGDIGVDDGATTAVAATPAETSKTRTRKTKRKIKTSGFLGDAATTTAAAASGDEVDQAPPKKKRRGGTKKKTKAADSLNSSTLSATTTKTKTKGQQQQSLSFSKDNNNDKYNKESSSIMTALPSTSTSGQLGRQNKRGSYLLPTAASRASSLKNKQKKSLGITSGSSGITPSTNAVVSSSSAASTNALTTTTATTSASTSKRSSRTAVEAPKPIETLYCGLQPSDSFFYPFLSLAGTASTSNYNGPTTTAMPPETSMKKCSKFHPVLDKIHSTISSAAAASSTTTPTAFNSADKDCPLIQLLMRGQQENSSAQHTNAAQQADEKTKKLIQFLSNLESTRQTVSGDKQRVIQDLKAVSTLMKRQHDFLVLSLHNMQRWCKKNFSPTEFFGIYGEHSSIFSSISTLPVVKVKVAFVGWTPPPKAGDLIAIVKLPPPPPPPPVAPSSTTSTTTSTTAPKKKRASANATNSTMASAGGSQGNGTTADKAATEDPSHVLSNNSPLTWSTRRQLIIEIMAKRAQLLEQKHLDQADQRKRILERQQNAMQKVVDEDDLVLINSATLWKWVEKAGMFADITDKDVRDLLVYHQPEHVGGDLPDDDNDDVEEGTPSDEQDQAPPLMERLQSLLVEVDSDDDGDDEESDSDSDDDDSSGEGWKSSQDDQDNTVIDLSALSPDERCYLHLRAIGLLDESSPPPPAVVEDENDDDSDVDVRVKDNTPVQKPQEQQSLELGATKEFDDVLQSMKTDLYQLHRLNNARLSFVESSARILVDRAKHRKQRNEASTQMISKYNQLLKKQKESKRSARQKSNKKDEDWVPW